MNRAVSVPAILLMLVAAACADPTAVRQSQSTKNTVVARDVGPTPEAPPKHAAKPVMVISSACVDGTDLDVRIDWSNQPSLSGENLTMDLSLRGAHGLSGEKAEDFIGPIEADGTVTMQVPPFVGPVPWDAWSRIDASATVAFTDAASIHQSKGGWPTC
jgi:hypothetical protein